MEKLNKQEKEFVKIKAETGNGTLAAQEAFSITDPNYAGVKANRLLRKDKIKEAILEELPDDLLLQVHREGLFATREYFNAKGENMGDIADFSVRHKYLDTAYKLRGDYAPEKQVTITIDATPTEKVTDLLNRLTNRGGKETSN